MDTLSSLYGLTTHNPPAWPSSGNSTPTPGDPVVISSATDGDYNAFPALCVDADRTLHCAWRKGTDHNSTANSFVAYMNKPFGGSWSDVENVVAYDYHGAGVNNAEPVFFPQTNGDLLMIYSTITVPGGLRQPYAKLRDSDGTWGESVALPAYPTGQLPALGARGDTWGTTMIVGCYARVAASGNRGIFHYEADTSDPTTWTYRDNPFSENNHYNINAEEPALIRRSDGLAMMIIRDDTTVACHMIWSPDLTHWSRPRQLWNGNGRPAAGINPYDDMLCINRYNPGGRAMYTFSGNSGWDWSEPAYLDDNLGAMMYGAVTWVRDRGWVGVYCVAGESGSPEEYTGPAVMYEIDFT